MHAVARTRVCLRCSYNVMSKRKLNKLVMGNFVRGWDDPRLLTLSGTTLGRQARHDPCEEGERPQSCQSGAPPTPTHQSALAGS